MSTTEEACRSIPGFGSDWDAAITHGVDVTLLLENLALSPAQRIERLDAQNRFAAEVQRRTLPRELDQALAAQRLREKLEALGPER
jgi:hypothetical protein